MSMLRSLGLYCNVELGWPIFCEKKVRVDSTTENMNFMYNVPLMNYTGN